VPILRAGRRRCHRSPDQAPSGQRAATARAGRILRPWRQEGSDRRGAQEGSRQVTRKRFERLVTRALETIPARFRREMKNVAVVIEDEPSEALLAEMDIEPPDTLFGLYQGTPLTERSWSHETAEPDRITIFQGPIEDACETEDDILVAVGETVIHEFGHYFGLDEEEIQEIEERYWRGEVDPE
jgi:predicted Zn-dependent protease with MMP-like domain